MPVSLVHRECSIAAATCYVRHRPEQTLLYQVVERHYPLFLAELENQGHTLPNYVQREFDNFLKCGRLEYGLLRIRCEACQAEKLVAFSCKRHGCCPSSGAKRMVESAALLVDVRCYRICRCANGCSACRIPCGSCLPASPRS